MTHVLPDARAAAWVLLASCGCVDLSVPRALRPAPELDSALGLDSALKDDRATDPDASPGATPEAAADPGPLDPRPVDAPSPDAASPDAPPPVDSKTCLPTALIGHWKLDEAAGLTAYDSSCHQNDGMLRGYVTGDWRLGRIGGALGLDGAKQWVEVQDSTSLDEIATRKQITIAAWVNKTATPISGDMLLSRHLSTDLSQEHYSLRLSTSGKLSGAVRSTPLPYLNCEDPQVFMPSRWVHAAVTYDGATLRLYKDGGQVCSVVGPSNLTADNTPLIIGGNVNNASGIPERKLSGLLDEVLIYARALSAAEITRLAFAAPPPAL